MGRETVASQAWRPEGFWTFRELYPRTPELPNPGRDLTASFCEHWHRADDDAALKREAARTTVVLVRGFLGNWMPGNLVGVRAALRRMGFDVVLWRGDTSASLRDNVEPLVRALMTRGTREQLVMCGHSRGGHLARLALAASPELSARCRGVVLSQTPRGPSLVVESLLQRRHQASLVGWHRRTAELLQRAGLIAVGARAGGLELTQPVFGELLREIDALPSPFPVVQMASWSSQPTTWLDSFHERLDEIAPGVAHDGQFLLSDLVWPSLPNVLLPHIDHAQPAMGGHGFDPGRYWASMLSLLFAEL